jgi:acyl carrier protein
MGLIEPGAEFEASVRNVLPELDARTPFSMDLDLWECGLDSFATIQLIVEFEQCYGIEFADEDMVPETFQTPRALWSTISKHVTAAPDPAPDAAAGVLE